jgi:putative oxidoreductase
LTTSVRDIDKLISFDVGRAVRLGERMNSSMNPLVLLLGRVLISVIFLHSGVGQITDFDHNVAHVASAGMPLPQVAIGASIVVQILGGLAVLLGFRMRLAAWALFVFLIPTTIMLHRFWGIPEAQAHMVEIQFFKNLAIMGGLLFVTSSEAGAYSVDALLARKGAVAPEGVA